MSLRFFITLVVIVQWLLCGQASRGQVFLNELCADNGGAAVSPGGTSPDYIELYNTNSAAVDLSTWTLTDDVALPAKYQFPSGTLIPARGRVVVWLESSSTTYTGLATTNFNLKSSGEEVALYQSGVQKDHVQFGPQIKDMVINRSPDGTGGWKLGTPTPLATNAAVAASAFGTNAALRINEWLGTNSAGATFDWLELYNPGTNGIVVLGGLVVSDMTNSVTTAAIITNTYISPGGFVRFWCDSTTNLGNHLEFKISSALGETLSVYQANRTTIIDRVAFGPQTVDVSQGRLPDGGSGLFYFAGTNLMTPGAANYFKPLTNIVINEVLAHTDLPLEDAIELYNSTASPVDISYWWISNAEEFPLKFQIPAGTVIAARGYKVFYEQNQSTAVSATPGFNRSGSGSMPEFTFNSAHGDFAVLTEGVSNGTLTGYRTSKNFGGSENGVSFGRHVKSNGGTDFVPMAARTFGNDSPATITQFRSGVGLTNSYPLIGPVVISEILYYPPPVVSGGVTNDNILDEFIELTSVTNGTLHLYDTVYPTNRWRLSGAVDFTFPTNTSLTATGRVLVVSFNPKTNLVQLAAFRSTYSVATNIPVFGPYSRNLGNVSDTVVLEKPDTIQLPPHPDAGFVPFVLVEKVTYQTTNGWPANAAGSGRSIQRQSSIRYANDPINWLASTPTAGLANHIIVSPIITAIAPGTTTRITINSILGVNYVLEYETSLSFSNWTGVAPIAAGTGGSLTLSDTNNISSQRFYRVRAE